jgi:hypothetical protein
MLYSVLGCDVRAEERRLDAAVSYWTARRWEAWKARVDALAWVTVETLAEEV